MQSHWFKRAAIVAACAVGLLLRPTLASATLAVLTDDTFTSTTAGNPQGTQPQLKVQQFSSTTIRSFIKFDFSTLPCAPSCTGADVSQAILRLLPISVATPNLIEVRQVTSAWDEATLANTTVPYPTTVPLIPGLQFSVTLPNPSAIKDYVLLDITDRTGCKFQVPQNSRRLIRVKARSLNPR